MHHWKLLYLTPTRPDIMQVISIVGIFHETPIQSHLLATKGILKYLRETIDYGLWYRRGKYFSFNIHTNVDWEGDVDDQKTTSGCSFFLGECLISRLIKKQASISLSTAKVENIVSNSCFT